ncbi:MAG: phosphate/phosphite/phosphonate ABC transporter substrate-binding protein [Leptolyngbyaceae cyanobacterium bins.349]|nr:phosphate/phosphite/phosphonate ABC transporter substrate-binding protein [Leptolyngbyaceae cyanobacterium bins.349]
MSSSHVSFSLKRQLLSRVGAKSAIAAFFPFGLAGLPLVLLFISACSPSLTNSEPDSKSPAPSPVAVAQRAATLRISVLPTQNQTVQKRMIAPLESHLERVLGQPVDFLIAADYKDNVDMLVDGRANAAYTGAVSYLEALERGAKVEPLVAPIDRFTARPWYRACIIVAANRPIKTLADLKGRRVAFVNPSSTSGYQMPLASLRQSGIEPKRDFAEVIFGGTHAKTEALLEAGKVDAIATNIPSYQMRQTLGKLTPQNSRILWESAPVPHSPFLVAQDLPPALVEKLKEAFLTVPPGLQDIVGTQAAGYTLVVAADYDPIRVLRDQLNLRAEGRP